jgi:peroxiredoxin family protein
MENSIAFVIAIRSVACGMKVSMFFTFWATGALKKSGRQAKNKTFVERMIDWMLPGGFNKQKLSKLDMGGSGRWMMPREMPDTNS